MILHAMPCPTASLFSTTHLVGVVYDIINQQNNKPTKCKKDHGIDIKDFSVFLLLLRLLLSSLLDGGTVLLGAQALTFLGLCCSLLTLLLS